MSEKYEVSFRDARSCADYKLRFPNATDGEYDLDLDADESTPLQRVSCDFTDGWTKIMSLESSISDLDELGDTSEISASFYTDPVLGIGWGVQVDTGGANPTPYQIPCFKLTKVKYISAIKIKVTWDGISGLGYMYITNRIDPSRYTDRTTYNAIFHEEGFLEVINAWAGWGGALGQQMVIQYKQAPEADVTVAHFPNNSRGNFTTTSGTYTSNGDLEICMGSELAGTYDRRFITEMSFK